MQTRKIKPIGKVMKTSVKKQKQDLCRNINSDDIERLVGGRHHNPHAILGSHQLDDENWVVRAWHPRAVKAEFRLPDQSIKVMSVIDERGLFAAPIDHPTPGSTLIFYFMDGSNWETVDPYSFSPSLGELDLHLLREGRHQRLFNHLGAIC